MIAVTELYCEYNNDFYQSDYPKVRYKMVGNDYTFYVDIDEHRDVLSIGAFDYSMLHTLSVQSIYFKYMLNVDKLLTLSVTSLSICGQTCLYGDSIDKILKQMTSLNTLQLSHFNNKVYDVSALSKLTSFTLKCCSIADIVTGDNRKLDLELQSCVVDPAVISDLYTRHLDRKAINKLTIEDCHRP